MSRSVRLLNKVISVAILISLLIGPFAPILYVRANQPNVAGSLYGQLNKGPLYRTHITLRQPTDLAKIEQTLAVQILEIGDGWALLVVNEEQLQALAQWRYQPRQTDSLISLGFRSEMLNTTETLNALAAAQVTDNDNDGLTDTEESWWCTDPSNANSDGDVQGYTDGQEVTALLNFTLPRSG